MGKMGKIWKTVRYASRALIRNPTFSLATVLVLALGIGANSAMFSLLNAVVIRSLPYADADRIAVVWMKFRGSDTVPIPPVIFENWRNKAESFEALAAFYPFLALDVIWNNQPEQLQVTSVSSNFFQTLGVRAAIGRTFVKDVQSGTQGLVLSQAFWQRFFGGDPEVIGRTFMMSGQAFTITGVAPQGFNFPPGAELWAQAPLPVDIPQLRSGILPRPNNASSYLQVFGRLREGVGLEQARAELSGRDKDTKGRGANLVPLQEQIVGDVRQPLQIVMGTVALVLLIACINAASLLYARSIRRGRELAVRTALGADRKKLLWLLLTESLLVALAAGVIGLMLGYGGLRYLVSLDAGNIPRLNEVAMDGDMLIFTLLISLLTGLLFGLIPAIRASKADPIEALKDGGRGALGSKGRLQQGLLVAQVAVTVILLAGTGLLLKSFVRLQASDPGFEASRLLTFRIVLSNNRYPQSAQWSTFFRQLLEQLEATPGVESAASVYYLPFPAKFVGGPFYPETGFLPSEDEEQRVGWESISPNYFRTMGIPILEGRDFGPQDTADAPPVAIISQTTARRFWPDGNPIGKRISERNPSRRSVTWRTVVGIVADVTHGSLEKEGRAEVYFPFQQLPANYMDVALKTRNDPLALTGKVRQAVAAIDPGQPFVDLQSMEGRVSDSVMQRRFLLTVVTVFGAVGILLVSVGIYGVTAYVLGQRRPEIGMRLALGAQPGDVLSRCLGQGVRLNLVGIVLGLGGALALTRLLQNQLYQVSAADPWIYLAVAAITVAVSLLANLIPSYRASRVDPLQVLRYE